MGGLTFLSRRFTGLSIIYTLTNLPPSIVLCVCVSVDPPLLSPTSASTPVKQVPPPTRPVSGEPSTVPSSSTTATVAAVAAAAVTPSFSADFVPKTEYLRLLDELDEVRNELDGYRQICHNDNNSSSMMLLNNRSAIALHRPLKLVCVYFCT